MKTKKKILIVVAIIVLIGLGIGAKLLLDVQSYQNQIAALQVNEIDLAKVPDGSYEGSYDTYFIKVKVRVEVKDHAISNIDLLQHENGKGASAEAIIPEVIQAQSLDVDAVSGATNSSKVILKSIELAINSAK